MQDTPFLLTLMHYCSLQLGWHLNIIAKYLLAKQTKAHENTYVLALLASDMASEKVGLTKNDQEPLLMDEACAANSDTAGEWVYIYRCCPLF